MSREDSPCDHAIAAKNPRCPSFRSGLACAISRPTWRNDFWTQRKTRVSRERTPGVAVLPTSARLRVLFVNALRVAQGDRYTLVDAESGSARRIQVGAARHFGPLRQTTLQTHGHFDHVGCSGRSASASIICQVQSPKLLSIHA